MIPAVVLPLLVAAADPKPSVLPADWHGAWAGTLKIATADGTPAKEVPMSLAVAPIPGGPNLTWTITYGDGDTKQVRNYKLVPGRGGRFDIDEGNDIKIAATLFGDTLTTLYRVGDTTLHTRYQRTAARLTMETTTFGPAAKPANGVSTFPPTARQSADMTKP